MAAMPRPAVLDPVYFTSEPVYKLSHSLNVLVYIPCGTLTFVSCLHQNGRIVEELHIIKFECDLQHNGVGCTIEVS